MWRSDPSARVASRHGSPGRSIRGRHLAAALVATLAVVPAAASAQTGTMRVHESAFNALADAIQPIKLSGSYRFTATVWTPFGTGVVTICDSPWSATVRQLAFAIDPGAIRITGTVDATWCGVSFTSELSTTASASYTQSTRSIRIAVNSTSIRPQFNVFGYTVTLPVEIDVAPSLTLPPLPVGTTLLNVETADGSVSLRMTPRNVTIQRRANHLELTAAVNVW